jgi:hypothetical protein
LHFLCSISSHICPFVTLCSSDGICVHCVFQMLPVLTYQTYVVWSTRQSLDIFCCFDVCRLQYLLLVGLYQASWVRRSVAVWLALSVRHAIIGYLVLRCMYIRVIIVNIFLALG